MPFTNLDFNGFLIEAGFMDISQTVTAVEKSLDDDREKAEAEFNDLLHTRLLETPYEQIDMAQDHLHRVMIRTPDLILRGLFVSIWSAFEHEMAKMAQEWARDNITDTVELNKSLKRLRDLGGVKTFWEENGVTYPNEWDVLDNIREARNLVVHHE